MLTGLDAIWAMEYLLDRERQERNLQREVRLTEIVRVHLSPFGDEAGIIAGTQALLRLRSFSTEYLQEFLTSLVPLFPKLKALAPNEAEFLASNVLKDVKEVSSSTFGTRSRISTILAVLRAAEPGYSADQAEHLAPESQEELERKSELVQAFSITSADDFQKFLLLLLDNYLAFERAESSHPKSKRFVRTSDSNLRMYNRNWEEWSSEPSIFDRVLEIKESGLANAYAVRRLEMLNNRRLRRARGIEDVHFTQSLATFERSVPRWKTIIPNSDSLRQPGFELTLTSFDEGLGLSANRRWRSVPRDFGEVEAWIAGVLEIWGLPKEGFAYRVRCSVLSGSETSEMSFTAANPSEGASKASRFVSIAQA